MNLSDRMKHYERSVGSQLTLRCPAILRLDGRAFHTFTKPFARPYDGVFRSLMAKTAQHLCGCISTSCFAYGQSDEISNNRHHFLDFAIKELIRLKTLVASEATNAFNQALGTVLHTPIPAFSGISEKLQGSMFRATFDARVFSVPERDVANYFVWRQHDATRNAISALGQAHFSPKQLHGKSSDEIIAMVDEKSKTDNQFFATWDAQPDDFKYGFTICYEKTLEMGISSNWCYCTALDFAAQRLFFEQLLEPED